MSSQLFREPKLRRIGSPEQLDQLIVTTAPRDWIALLAMTLLTGAAGTWSVMGRLPSKVPGQGMIMRTGGVQQVISNSAGRISEIRVRPGDKVEKAQIVAVVDQPMLAKDIRDARAELAEAEAELRELTGLEYTRAAMQTNVLARQRTAVELQLKSISRQIEQLRKQTAIEEPLAVKGLITRQSLMASQQRIAGLEDEIQMLEVELGRSRAAEWEESKRPDAELLRKRNVVRSLTRRVQTLELAEQESSFIASPWRGRVLEWKAEPGATIEVGRNVLLLEGDSSRLEAVIFVPAARGKELRPGMQVEIAPSMVKRQAYGHMLATVTFVSSFPVASDTLARRLGNESLTAAPAGYGPVTEVRAELAMDPHTRSGFRWSSSKGPDLTLTPGTLCTAEVVTLEERPIVLLFPFLRRLL